MPTTMTQTDAVTTEAVASAQSSRLLRAGPPKLVQKGTKLDFEGNISTLLSGLSETFGTSDEDLICTLLGQVIDAVPNRKTGSREDWNPVVAALHGIHPQDALEGLLAVQMIAGHNLAMEFLRRAALKEQPTPGVDLNLNRATKLLRTFTAQILTSMSRDRFRASVPATSWVEAGSS
ncbi:MAG: hypothetical protein LAN83_17335 [Acidobacteriia bacterium]|nr:hypothetical protein [Terriglobia bacterium]